MAVPFDWSFAHQRHCAWRRPGVHNESDTLVAFGDGIEDDRLILSWGRTEPLKPPTAI